MKPRLCVLLATLALTWVAKADPGEKVCCSQHFNVSAKLGNGWEKAAYINTPGDTRDEPDGVIRSFRNEKARLAYILIVTEDVPEITWEELLTANRTRITTSKSFESLIDEGEVTLHGKPFHRIRYVFDKKGREIVNSTHLYRDGARSVIIQWSYAVENDIEGGSYVVPESLLKFDQGVTLFEMRVAPPTASGPG